MNAPWNELPVLQTREERIAHLEYAVPQPAPLTREARRIAAQRKEVLRERERKYNAAIFDSPKGRVCEVARCVDCRRFCAYRDHSSKKKWGERADNPARFTNWWDQGICNDCYAHLKMVSAVARCDSCGVFRKEAPSGVWYRAECYTAENHDTQAIHLCVGCWNRIRRIFQCEREAKEVNSLINQLKKEIRL